jgi:hypothetical protein
MRSTDNGASNAERCPVRPVGRATGRNHALRFRHIWVTYRYHKYAL